MPKIQNFILTSILLISLISCQDNDKPYKYQKNRAQQVQLSVPQFNQDSAYFFIERQVNFGPRVPNTPAHDSCARWLEGKLGQYTSTVVVQRAEIRAFDGTILKMKNVIGSFNPEVNKRILLCAHWDSRPFADQDIVDKDKPILGANDGGSGVGVLLEVARLLKNNPLNIGIDIIFFDTEDYGQPHKSRYIPMNDTWCLGSQYWAKHPHKKSYYADYGILLDMVGAEEAIFNMEETSMTYAPSVVRKVWSIAADLGYSDYFRFERTYPVTDDHLYINKLIHIPTINIIQYDHTTSTRFGSYWHTHQDNMDIISRQTLKAVGQTIVAVIYGEKSV